MLMKGKRGLVVGVANKWSIAWGISQKLLAEGAELAFTYQNERLAKNVRELTEGIENALLIPMDVTSDKQILMTFELLKRELDKGRYHEFAGAGMVLTGGSSALRGIQHVAEEIFQMPVQICRAQNISGVTSAFENPQYSTAIGLVKYAQATLDDDSGGWLDWFKRWFR